MNIVLTKGDVSQQTVVLVFIDAAQQAYRIASMLRLNRQYHHRRGVLTMTKTRLVGPI
jgi:hypothetical protein